MAYMLGKMSGVMFCESVPTVQTLQTHRIG